MTVSSTNEQPVLENEETDQSEQAIAAVSEVEADIREFVRRDTRQLRRTSEATGEIFANNVNSLVQRVAGTSLREIDMLLRELEGLREFLHSEGERVQREVASYAHLSQTALNSTKIIAESVHQWRKLTNNTRAH
jgi:ABC-type transporter Mla subunit MlaD